MLTNINVDGFRSLSHFEMATRPGLNILIGPNGSGKSNIISFFQFLSRIMSGGLNDAVSLAGGVGAFFQKTGEQRFQNEIHVVLRGLTYTLERDLIGERARDAAWLQYEYEFTVQASERFDSIVFSQQKLNLKKVPGASDILPEYKPLSQDKDWDIVITSSSDPSQIRVAELKERTIDVARHRKVEKGQAMKEQLLELLQFDESGLQSTSLVSVAARPIDVVGFIVDDLLGGETLNINPNKVKEPEDSAREPGIRSDGSGLAATLWHMTNEPVYRRPTRFPMWSPFSQRRRRRWPKEIYEQLQSLTQLVNEQIIKVDVVNDPFDNQLKIKMKMRIEGGDIDLPLSAMSDGTIKWMSIITAILTSRTVFAIEEPENFLHPLMLIEILKLMRSTTADKFSFVIMTTHSETLLNAASPDEVVVVSMESGVTRGRRPRDPECLANEIRETGFGLGHYYLVGALNDA
jgi:predicted ATPase